MNDTRNIPLTELMPDTFIREHTSFHTLQDIANAAGIKSAADMQKAAWSEFVAAHSDFDGWESMQKAAVTEWMRHTTEQG